MEATNYNFMRLKTIKEFVSKKINEIRKYIVRKKAIGKLRKEYYYVREVEELMSDWITKRILDGQEGRRKELVEKQSKIQELDLFINYLKELK